MDDNTGPAPGFIVLDARSPILAERQSRIATAISEQELSEARMVAWSFATVTARPGLGEDVEDAEEDFKDSLDIDLELRGFPNGQGVSFDLMLEVNETRAWSSDSPEEVVDRPAAVLEGAGLIIKVGASAHGEIDNEGIEDIAGPEVVGVIVAGLRGSGWGDAIADRLESEGSAAARGCSSQRLAPLTLAEGCVDRRTVGA
jgi:hypothetical protein